MKATTRNQVPRMYRRLEMAFPGRPSEVYDAVYDELLGMGFRKVRELLNSRTDLNVLDSESGHRIHFMDVVGVIVDDHHGDYKDEQRAYGDAGDILSDSHWPEF